jgi:hypothetical protein
MPLMGHLPADHISANFPVSTPMIPNQATGGQRRPQRSNAALAGTFREPRCLMTTSMFQNRE